MGFGSMIGMPVLVGTMLAGVAVVVGGIGSFVFMGMGVIVAVGVAVDMDMLVGVLADAGMFVLVLVFVGMLVGMVVVVFMFAVHGTLLFPPTIDIPHGLPRRYVLLSCRTSGVGRHGTGARGVSGGKRGRLRRPRNRVYWNPQKAAIPPAYADPGGMVPM